MTPEQIDHVFGRGRLKMETGAHVEVFREAAPPGESRRYTKRFLTTADGDYAQWTEREWRILALLIGHGSRCVPDIVQYDRDARGTKLVQTYDAGATVDQWATLLPVERGGGVYARVFEDCAHWWALAHHCLVALDEIHSLQLVHLDIKGDNICIPIGPPAFDPALPEERLFPVFGKLRLIDFAFSLVSGENLPTPLPIGWQQDYDYQSPRLLHALEAGRAGDLRPTENLDWRCDMYSLAAMLKRYLPGAQRLCQPDLACGWTAARYDAAKALILRIREAHDGDLTLRRPHAELIMETSAHVRANELALSLEQGWTLARDAQPFAVPATPLTPVTRLALPLRLVIPPRDDIVAVLDAVRADERPLLRSPKRRDKVPLVAAAMGIAAIAILLFVTDSGAYLNDAARLVMDNGRTLRAAISRVVGADAETVATASSQPGMNASSATALAGSAASDSNAAATESPAAEADNATETAAAPTASSEPSPAPDETPSLAPEPEPAVPPAASSASPTSVPPSASPPGGGSRNKPSERYRSKSASPLPRIAKAPASPPPTAARTMPLRPAEAVPRPQLASVNKLPRATTATRAVATPPAQTIAAKRTGEAAFASRVPPSVQPTQVASAMSAPASDSAAAGAPPASQPLPATRIAAPAPVLAAAPASAADGVRVGASSSPSGAATSASIAGQSVAAAPSAAAPSAAAPSAALPALSPPPPIVAMAPPSVPAPAPSVEVFAPSAAPSVPSSRPFAAPSLEAPRPLPPRTLAEPRSRASPGESRDGDAYRGQARWVLDNVIPQTSARSHAQISRVLLIAASAYHPDQDRAVIAAATSPGVASDVAFVIRDFAPGDARRLHEEARQAYWSRRDIPEALDLQLRAFGANPYDPEIAGHLAFLYMKVIPAQPDRARQLALHAIGLRGGQNQEGPRQAGRTEDWTTFAIASALTGRDTDAKYGLYALVALTRNADRVCHVARSALATYGERLREPVDALLHRLRAQGRGDDSPNCASSTRVTRYP